LPWLHLCVTQGKMNDRIVNVSVGSCYNLLLSQWLQLQSVSHSMAHYYNLSFTPWHPITICLSLCGTILQSVFHSMALYYNLFLSQWPQLQSAFHSVDKHTLTIGTYFDIMIMIMTSNIDIPFHIISCPFPQCWPDFSETLMVDPSVTDLPKLTGQTPGSVIVSDTCCSRLNIPIYLLHNNRIYSLLC
jgi:hypothetical protein